MASARLTFQAWYRAQLGTLAWNRLGKIPRPMWMDYLRWYRRVLDVPVENGVSVDRVEPEGDLLRLALSGASTGTVVTRKLVFATGRDGVGEPNIPGFVKDLPDHLWAHSSGEIDFAALRGKRVAVVGWEHPRGQCRGSPGTRCIRGQASHTARGDADDQQADGDRKLRLHLRISRAVP